MFADRLRLPLAFDPALLARDLASAAAAFDWVGHYVPDNFTGDWSVIPLRCAAGAIHPIKMIYADPVASVFVDTPVLEQCPYFRAILDAFRCKLRAVRLMRLAPGSRIKEHTDLDLCAEDGAARIHIPITTNPDVEFYLNRLQVVMAAGSAWYLRLSEPHSVYNGGDTDRVHLVIDATVDPWLTTLLTEAAAESAAERLEAAE